MPFDRLIKTVEAWASNQSPTPEIFAQIGNTTLRPTLLKAVPALSPANFRDIVQNAELIIAHAGMGSVLTAMEFGKPLVVMPRLGSLRETRNDHQVATARWLAKKEGIFVAMVPSDLPNAIERAIREPPTSIQTFDYETSELVRTVRDFIFS